MFIMFEANDWQETKGGKENTVHAQRLFAKHCCVHAESECDVNGFRRTASNIL